MPVTFKYIKPYAGQIQCDKISITCPLEIGEPQIVIAAITQLLEMGHARKAYLSKTSMYRTNIEFLVSQHPPQYLFVQAHPRKPGMSFMRFEFNPSMADMSQVAAYIDALFPCGGYQRLVEKGTVTRLDIRQDVNLPLDQMLFTHPMLRATDATWMQGRLETLYLGSKTSCHYICIYDKVAEMKNKHVTKKIVEDIPNHPCTRIEVRLKKRIPLADLATLEDQFAKIGVSHFKKVTKRDDLSAMFLMAAQNAGAQTALLRLSAPNRKIYAQRLKEARALWWNPQQQWNSWPNVAKAMQHPVASFCIDIPKAPVVHSTQVVSHLKSNAIH